MVTGFLVSGSRIAPRCGPAFMVIFPGLREQRSLADQDVPQWQAAAVCISRGVLPQQSMLRCWQERVPDRLRLKTTRRCSRRSTFDSRQGHYPSWREGTRRTATQKVGKAPPTQTTRELRASHRSAGRHPTGFCRQPSQIWAEGLKGGNGNGRNSDNVPPRPYLWPIDGGGKILCQRSWG